ncbi:MAG: hypothetical protein JWQ96_2185 [Segetibacter sp.]|nr:hypothetical protein [Segetibacter sp.]
MSFSTSAVSLEGTRKTIFKKFHFHLVSNTKYAYFCHPLENEGDEKQKEGCSFDI